MYIDVKEMARRHCIGVAAVRQWIYRGQITPIMIEGRYYFTPDMEPIYADTLKEKHPWVIVQKAKDYGFEDLDISHYKSVKEYSKEYGISKFAVRQRIRRGTLDSMKVNGRLYICTDDE